MDIESSLQEFLEFVIGRLIDQRDLASISRRHDEEGRLVFDITVDDSDVGRVIGKNGYTISSIRSLLDASAEKSGIKVRIKVHSTAEEGAPKLLDE